MQGRVEAALLQIEVALGLGHHRLGDLVTVGRPARNYVENEHVEHAPQQSGIHEITLYIDVLCYIHSTSMYACQTVLHIDRRPSCTKPEQVSCSLTMDD